jgi:hypothetical protein
MFLVMASCDGGDWMPVSSLTRRAEFVASDVVPVSGTQRVGLGTASVFRQDCRTWAIVMCAIGKA